MSTDKYKKQDFKGKDLINESGNKVKVNLYVHIKYTLQGVVFSSSRQTKNIFLCCLCYCKFKVVH